MPDRHTSIATYFSADENSWYVMHKSLSSGRSVFFASEDNGISEYLY
jgi:hypothetical protein